MCEWSACSWRSYFNYPSSLTFCFFFFNDTATTEIYTLSLHDALPISEMKCMGANLRKDRRVSIERSSIWRRSEEHTSELQSHSDLVCRLLLEKKKERLSAVRRATRRKTARAPRSLRRRAR